LGSGEALTTSHRQNLRCYETFKKASNLKLLPKEEVTMFSRDEPLFETIRFVATDG
jgi:hypothetical protein